MDSRQIIILENKIQMILHLQQFQAIYFQYQAEEWIIIY